MTGSLQFPSISRHRTLAGCAVLAVIAHFLVAGAIGSPLADAIVKQQDAIAADKEQILLSETNLAKAKAMAEPSASQNTANIAAIGADALKATNITINATALADSALDDWGKELDREETTLQKDQEKFANDIRIQKMLGNYTNTTSNATSSLIKTMVDDALFLVPGIFYLCVGYRFFRPSMFLAGFTFASTAVFAACYGADTDMESAGYIFGTIAGSAFGFVCLYVYPLGVFILGANWGVVMAFIINGLFLVPGTANTSLWILIVLFGLFGGGLAANRHHHTSTESGFRLGKFVIFSETAWVGSYMTIRSIAALTDKDGWPYELTAYEELDISESYQDWLMTTIVFALLGTCLQLFITHWEHCGCSAADWDESKEATLAAKDDSTRDVPDISPLLQAQETKAAEEPIEV